MNKKYTVPIGVCPKGQFSKNAAYLERGMPCFAFVHTNAVLVSKIDRLVNKKGSLV